MNKKQKIVLWVGIAAFVLMGLYPPWMISKAPMRSEGYSFVLAPPVGTIDETFCQINMPRLYIQWMIVVVIGGLVISFKKQAKRINHRPG